MQTLTFRLNINELVKYEKGANLFNNPLNKINRPQQYIPPNPPPPLKLEGEGACHA